MDVNPNKLIIQNHPPSNMLILSHFQTPTHIPLFEQLWHNYVTDLWGKTVHLRLHFNTNEETSSNHASDIQMAVKSCETLKYDSILEPIIMIMNMFITRIWRPSNATFPWYVYYVWVVCLSSCDSTGLFLFLSFTISS